MAISAYDIFRMELERYFGIEYKIYKQKSHYLMIELYMDGEHLSEGRIHGPDAGYSMGFGENYSFTAFGWAYEYDIEEDAWYLLPDGRCGWRQGSNPFPDIHAK